MMCWYVQGRPGDFPSIVAWRAGVSLARFLLNNTDTIKYVDAPLEGQKVLLCDPRRGEAGNSSNKAQCVTSETHNLCDTDIHGGSNSLNSVLVLWQIMPAGFL